MEKDDDVSDPADVHPEVAPLRDRMSRLSAAIRRVSASLDVDTVLSEVVESARALTGASYGVITTIDTTGQSQDFVTSGITAKQHQELVDWPEGPRLFEHFRDLPGTVRLTDLPAYALSLGLAADLMPSKTLVGTPLRHREVHVGNFYLGDKEGGKEFTDEDEETLVLFASQAVTAIANARTYRDERRAQADLEAMERSRVEFLSRLSHELRAPLLAIKGAAATVLSAASSPDAVEVREVLRIVDEQADHMRSLVSDLLDAGRIEAGMPSVAPGPADVGGLVDQARNTFLSGGGRHTVAIDLPRDLPRVLADRQRIVQVLNNLFANASRHAPESSPIQVLAVPDGAHVTISVVDQGRGVPPERLPHLFREHARVGSEGGIGGTGLGLAICKGMIRATPRTSRQCEASATGRRLRVGEYLPLMRRLSRCERARFFVSWPPGGERIACPKLREQREITVTSEQRRSTMGNAERSDPGIVNHRPVHARSLDEAAQDIKEVVGLAQQSTRRRRCPRIELTPGALDRCRPVLPDAAVGYDAQELVAARPWNRPCVVAFRELAQDGARGTVDAGFPAVRVDEQISVDGDHGVSWLP